jgi:hypothetical protein
MLGFLVVAIGTGVAVYHWRDRIENYVSDGIPNIRVRAADALERLGRQAVALLDRTRAGVDTWVRAGQERIRPEATTGGTKAEGSRRRVKRADPD